MRRLLIIVTFFTLSVFVFAGTFYKDLGTLEIDTVSIFNPKDYFPLLSELSVVDASSVNAIGTNSEIRHMNILDFVNVKEDQVLVTPTMETPPGTYYLFFVIKEGDLENLLIVEFKVPNKFDLKINPQSIFLEDTQELNCMIHSNSKWRLFVCSFGAFPSVDVSINEKTISITETPTEILSGLGGKEPVHLKINLKLISSYHDTPTGYYNFPIIFTLVSD